MSKYLLDLTHEFSGLRALVTGGTRGIGAAAAQRLIEGGAKVVVTARNPHAETSAGAIFIAGDTRTKEGATAVGHAALKALDGKIDILINSAGALRLHPNLEAIPDDEWLDSLNVNFLATLRVTAAVLPALKQSRHGAIVNVSAGGLLPLAGAMAHSGAAKAALNSYSRALAKELAPLGIRVNIVTHSPIYTPGGEEVRRQIIEAIGITDQQFMSSVPLQGRGGTSEELAEVIAFLVSSRDSYVTGHNHFVTGGWGEFA